MGESKEIGKKKKHARKMLNRLKVVQYYKNQEGEVNKDIANTGLKKENHHHELS